MYQRSGSISHVSHILSAIIGTSKRNRSGNGSHCSYISLSHPLPTGAHDYGRSPTIIRYSSGCKKNYIILSLSMPLTTEKEDQQTTKTHLSLRRPLLLPETQTRTPYFPSSSLFPHPPSSLQSSPPPSLRTGKVFVLLV
ncbi:uncharacterized protein LOC114287039 [Camellia sinensis]|uniref:uncharacterized protein LOC114287039 n=1 Tax=Camellia sinensis TaxID=4442 RepID=UPI0010362555|nr:uncharacterized protein LOC114287039 [Camellia sinensis]